MRTLTTTLAALTLALTTACGTSPDDGTPVDRATFEENGHQWPLTVDEGTVHQNGDAIYFEDPDGKTYALNGPAAENHDPLDPIWLEDEQIAQAVEEAGEDPGDAIIPKVSVDALIDAAG